MVQALTGKPMTVYGDGSQTRSFCYVDDLVEGFLRLMAYEGSGCHEPHNLGNPEEFTMMQLAEVVQEAVGRRSSGDSRALAGGRPRDSAAPTSRAVRERLRLATTVPLAEGVARTAAEFRRLARAA